MPLNDIDVVRRRHSIGLPVDLVDFIVYSYNEEIFEEKHFQSASKLIDLLKQDTTNAKSYWIEVINRSSVHFPGKIKLLCEYFDIHPLTMEDISTLATYMKIDIFNDQFALYLLLKIISWNGQRVEQQQISFYVKYSKKVLITFQENSTNDQSFFDSIRNQLRSKEPSSNNRLKQMNIDYLFYCLFDAIIDRSIFVVNEIAQCIDQLDEQLMTDKQALKLDTLKSIYYLKHDLLHLRILFNPLIEIMSRLQRIIDNNQCIFHPHIETKCRLDLKHHIIRRQITTFRHSPRLGSKSSIKPRRTSAFLNEKDDIYVNDLNDHIIELIQSLEIQRDSVSNLLSFWMHLNNNETEEILKFLMLISILFMPCFFLVGINSTNFKVQQQLEYKYGYYILLILLATISFGMITWYKLKQWI